MKTMITDSPIEAASYIKAGGVVAFPTETVYGLGADVFNASAIEKIFIAKNRPADNPLIAHVASLDQLGLLAAEITDSARLFLKRFSPGPLTAVLRKSDRVSKLVTAGLDTVGIRIPGSDLARQFLIECRTPVAAPSANLSGRPSPTTWQAVLEDLDGHIDCILKGDATKIGLESTVVDCTSEVPVVLRPGAISLEDLRSVVPSTKALDASNNSEIARSPGMLHRHYSPKAKVILIDVQYVVDEPQTAAYIGLTSRLEAFALVKVCASSDEYARNLFEFFRQCDRSNIHTIYCERVETVGIGTALMDRLRRAAEN
jgi:L-threonylcarbamoyladenylate synthase